MKKILSIFKDLKTKDAVIILIIVALPFLFYTYKFVPHGEVWETDWFIINLEKWNDTRTLFWILNFKLMLISLLIIWFVTCKHWWRYVVLAPMIIELFKLRSIFDISTNNIDEIEFLQSLPFTIPVILFVLLLSKKLGYFSKYKSLREEINYEIECLLDEVNILEQKDLIKLKGEFENIKRNKSKMTITQYNNKLLKLRKQLVGKL